VSDAGASACDGGSCGKAPGASCQNDNECGSGLCAQRVCCNLRCSGPCVSCNQPGKEGQCLAVAENGPDGNGVCSDRGASNCDTNGKCDGRGACQHYVEGTPCHASTCDSTTNVQSDYACMGGACITTQQACGSYRCNGNQCGGSCMGNQQCVSPSVCT